MFVKRGVFEMGEGNADACDTLSVREAINMFQKEKSATALPLLVWYLCVRKGNAITCMFLKRLFMTREDKSASYLSQIHHNGSFEKTQKHFSLILTVVIRH